MKCLLIKMSNEHISHLSRKKMKLVHSNVARPLTKGLNKFSSNSIHMHTSDEISIIQLNKEMFTENVAFGASILKKYCSHLRSTFLSPDYGKQTNRECTNMSAFSSFVL